MSQDNQKNLIQFCRELDSIVNEILNRSDELLAVLEGVLHLYRPKSQEDAEMFYNLRFKLPDSAGLLCDIRKISIPDDNEFYDKVAPLSEMAVNVANRMIMVNVIIHDITSMHIEPHDNDLHIHLYLAMLSSVSSYIFYTRSKLEVLHMEIRQIWPDLIVRDYDTEEVEDSVVPGEVESFQNMRAILVKAFAKYAKEHDSERISDFFAVIQEYLEDFAAGVEPEKEFDFGFVWKTENDEPQEFRYIDFHFELGMLEVTSGGSFYNTNVGSDSYTNWNYSIDINGWDDNNGYHFMSILELVHAGAKLTIESPDEFIGY